MNNKAPIFNSYQKEINEYHEDFDGTPIKHTTHTESTDNDLNIAWPTKTNRPKISLSQYYIVDDVREKAKEAKTDEESLPYTKEQLDMARELIKLTEKTAGGEFTEEPVEEVFEDEEQAYTKEQLDMAREMIKLTEKTKEPIVKEAKHVIRKIKRPIIEEIEPAEKFEDFVMVKSAEKPKKPVAKEVTKKPEKKIAKETRQEIRLNTASVARETAPRKENISKIKGKGHILGRWFYGTKLGQWWQDLDTKQFSSNLRPDQIEERRKEIEKERERLGIKTKSEKKNTAKVSGETRGESSYEDFKNSILEAFMDSDLSREDPSIGKQFRKLFNMPTDEMKMDAGEDGYSCYYHKLLSEIKKNDVEGIKSSLAFLIRETQK